MIHEYAVNPDSLSSFNEIWQALEQFGVQHGRMLVGCPKKWWGVVQTNLAVAETKLPPAEYKELEERCFRLKEDRILIYRKNLNFDGQAGTWVKGLLPEHRTRPFRAVLQLEPERNDEIPILSRFDFKDRNPLWKAERSVSVGRNETELADAVIPLLRISTDFLLIDPYFNGDYRHCQSLGQMLTGALQQGAVFDRVEVHTKTTASATFLSDKMHKHVFDKVVNCPNITVFKWQQRAGDERLHDRFILTDRGGVEIPGGTDVGEQGQTTNVHLLSDTAYRTRWDQYQQETAAFEFIEKFKVGIS